ncbi:MAG: YdbH domain-containing protein [Alphaproteobacteria bacterium]
MARRPVRLVLGASIVAGALVAAALVAAPALVAGRIERALAAQGFAGARVEGVSLGLGGARIESLWLDAEGAGRLGAIDVRYDLGQLLGGRVESLAIEHGSLRLAFDGDTMTLAGVPPAGGAGRARMALPVGRIDIDELAVSIDLTSTTMEPAPSGIADRLGPFVLGLYRVRIEPRSDAIAAHGGFVVNAGLDPAAASPTTPGRLAVPLNLDGRFEAIIGDSASVSVEVESGWFSGWGVKATPIVGWLVVAAGDGSPEVAGELGAELVEVGGLVLDDATVLVDGVPAALTVIARADGPFGADAELDGTLRLVGPVEAVVEASITVPDLSTTGSTLSGRLFAYARGRVVAVPATGLPSFTGLVTVVLSESRWPGLVEDLRVEFEAGLHADAAGIAIGASGGLPTVRAEGRWVGATPATLAPLVDETIAVTADLPLKLAVLDDGFALTGSGAVTVDAADGQRARLELGGLAATLGDRATSRLDRLDYRLMLPGFDLGPGVVRRADVRGTLSGAPGAWSGTIDGTVEGRIAIDEPSIVVDAASARLRARFTIAGSAIDVAPTDCLSIRAKRVVIGEIVVRPTNVVCVMSLPDAPFATFGSDGGVTLGLRILPFLAELAPLTAGAFPPVSVTAPRARLRMAVEQDGRVGFFAADLAGGSAAMPDRDAAFSLVEAEVTRDRGAPYAFKLRGDVKHTAEPAAVVPLGMTLEGSVAPGVAIDVEGTLRGGNGALAADVALHHDLALLAGHASATLHPLSFVPDVRDPADLFPILAGTVGETSGTIEAKADLAWTASRAPDGRAELAIRDLATTAAGVSARAINGVLAFDGLVPPSLPPGQTISIGLLDIGVPLVNGIVAFGLARDGMLQVERAEWRWAEGLVFAEPFTADLGQREWRVTLGVRGLDLGAILALTEVDGLEGTGVLAGRLPLRLGFATVAIEDGVLETTGPGILRYAPPAGTGVLDSDEAGTTLLLDALANFHYDSLAMTLAGAAGGETTVGLRLMGRNPDLYEGYPVALNVNLSGALDTLLRRGLAGYRIPETVRERLESFGGEGP